MSENEEGRPPTTRTGTRQTDSSLSVPRFAEILTRRHRRALDRHIGLAAGRRAVPYADGGMTLGWLEREAAAPAPERSAA